MFDFSSEVCGVWEGGEDGEDLLVFVLSGGVGGRLRDLLARGDLPTPSLLLRIVRSIGALGEAGEESRDLPTEPMGEQVISLDLLGECGGRMEAFLRSRGVMGDLMGVCREAGGGLVRGEGWRGE